MLKSALEEGPPGIYRYASKGEVDRAFAAAADRLNRQMTPLEFYRVLAPTVATSQDIQQTMAQSLPLIPIEVRVLKNKIYVFRDYSPKRRTRRCPGRGCKRSPRADSLRTSAPPCQLPTSGSMTELWVLKIYGFGGKGEGDKPLDAYYQDVYNDLRERNIQGFIIDVRDNGGGADELGRKLFGYLVTEPFQYYNDLVIKKLTFDFFKYVNKPSSIPENEMTKPEHEVPALVARELKYAAAREAAFRRQSLRTDEWRQLLHHLRVPIDSAQSPPRPPGVSEWAHTRQADDAFLASTVQIGDERAGSGASLREGCNCAEDKQRCDRKPGHSPTMVAQPDILRLASYEQPKTETTTQRDLV